LKYYEDLKKRLQEVASKENIGQESITVVSAYTLKAEEAIGNPERKDYPLLKGKEFMIEATFIESRGQAYTDMPGNYQGSLDEVITLPLSNHFHTAIFIATLNAVMRHFNLVPKTVHCKDKEPGICASELPEYISKRYGKPKISLVGYQPAMAAALTKCFPLRILDLDLQNIGQEKSGTLIEGPEKTEEVLAWSDLILATGSALVNTSLEKFLGNKPGIFYGVTIAGVTALYGYQRYCPYSH